MPTRFYRIKEPRLRPKEAAPLLSSRSFVADASVRKTLTVSELAGRMKELFEETFTYPVWVEGELSDPKVYPSGHLWFDLKDAKASLKSVMWRDNVRGLKFAPEQGLQVICLGRATFYPPRGEVKFEVLSIEPQGMGALQLAFEQLKEKLQKEGFFSEERKRPLPLFPERIGIVTSPRGAAIDDMLKVFGGRVRIILRPVRVQGDGAAAAIAAGIRQLSVLEELDLIIAGRGGGSLEDLWAFNEEAVARAIFSCPLPVISAVGHEKDFCIADLVADVRAATPTQAAEMVMACREELSKKVGDLEAGLLEGVEQPVLFTLHRLKTLQGGLLGCSPQAILLHQAERLRRLQGTLCSATAHPLQQSANQVHGLAGRLHALSPLAVLARGYSITFDEQGRIIKKAASVKPGDTLRTKLHRGFVRSRVESTET